MAIPDEDVAAVRSATDIVALIGEYTPLKRSGRRFVGLCPFHSEKSPSFSVNAEEGLYYCFGCQASGDPITFLRAIEGSSFVEAVEALAARAGIAITEDAGPDREARDRRKALYEAMEKAVSFYHERLLRHPDAAKARQYLRSRGFDAETVKRFRLGWAPEGGNHLVAGVKVPRAALATTGLLLQGNYGPRDAFRGRVIFPISQPDGKPVALGGRLVPGIGKGEGPKYRNSPETPIYQKRSTLYALNLSRTAIVQTGEIIVCEGYTDVIGFYRAGLERAVATCGTALTEEHFKLLARFGRRIVLAFDADKAGQSAAARFYEWEKRHEIEVTVADLPAGKDPGELAESDPDRLRAAVDEARSYLDFRLQRALGSDEMRSPEARARTAELALAVVAEHPNELVRDQYLMQVADRTRVDVEQLRPLLAHAVASERSPSRPPGTTRRPADSSAGSSRDDEPPPRDEDGHEGTGPGRPAQGASPPRTAARKRATPGERAGRDALALAIHEPREMAGRIDGSLFADPVQKNAFRVLSASASLHEAIEGADDEAAALLAELANSDPGIGVDQAVIALARTTTTEALSELEADVRQAQAAGDSERLIKTNEVVVWLKSELELFGEVGAADGAPRAVIEAADRLVAWLSAREGEAEGAR